MLQNIRKNLQGTIAKVIVAIIVVPFALFGIESLLTGGGVQEVASVNGQAISAIELQQEVNQQKRRLLMTMGENIDPAMLDDQFLTGPSLEFLIQKILLRQAADDYGLAVSDARIGAAIGEMEVFKVDGTFDQNLFRRVVSDQGYSPASFQQAMRDDTLVNQLRTGMAGTSFATPAEVQRLARLQQEQRDIRYMVLPLEQFRSDATITDEQVQASYDANQEMYMTEESVTLAFIELTPEDFHRPVEEERVRELFEIEKDSLGRAEERQVSHILLVQAGDEDDAAFAERVATAADLAQSEGADFAALAEELSDDIGSASLGGDLGYTTGDVFPEAMEEAIAVLDVGAVSGPVATDAGTHLITVTDIRGGSSPEFEDVRGELEARLRDEEATRQLVKTVETLRDLAFNAEDLAGPAAELELQVEQVTGVTRQGEGLFSDARLIAAAFSDDVLQEGYNSEVIEIDTEHFVVLRVVEHLMPEARPLESVRDSIVASLRDEQARGEIRNTARNMLTALRAGNGTIETLAQEGGFEWQVELGTTRSNPAVPRNLLQRAFELPAPVAGDSFFEYVQTVSGDIEIFELVRVMPGNPDSLAMERRRALQQQLVNENGQRTDEYYQQALSGKADITRS